MQFGSETAADFWDISFSQAANPHPAHAAPPTPHRRDATPPLSTDRRQVRRQGGRGHRHDGWRHDLNRAAEPPPEPNAPPTLTMACRSQVTYEDIVMENTVTPIYVFVGARQRRPRKGVGGIQNITIRRLRASRCLGSRGNWAATIDGQPPDPALNVSEVHVAGRGARPEPRSVASVHRTSQARVSITGPGCCSRTSTSPAAPRAAALSTTRSSSRRTTATSIHRDTSARGRRTGCLCAMRRASPCATCVSAGTTARPTSGRR